MLTKIDHLVVGARDLAQGTAYIKDLLGVDIPYGGAHLKMGTHNHLLQLGSDIFLELIAINPDLEPPESPRWFGLDDPCVRLRIQEQPVLLTWVVNTDNIDALLEHTRFSFGAAEMISRGNLSWYFGLPDDGRLLAGGMLPYIIEWHTHIHPSSNMADLGCRFQKLHIYHPQPLWLQSILESIGAVDLVCIHGLPKNMYSYLEAHIDTPAGIKILRSAAGMPDSLQSQSSG